jgi:ankyrin repeat protein
MILNNYFVYYKKSKLHGLRKLKSFLVHFKLFIYLVVIIGFNSSQAGTYEDFFKAIEFDQPQVILNLLKRGFDPNTPDKQGQPALIAAIRKPSPKSAEVLILWPKTKLNAQNPHDETPLMMAAFDNQIGLAKLLIEKGADVNKTGWTPLHYAATKGHVEMMKLLLEMHAYIDADSPNGTTPLMMAAHYGTPLATKLLLDEGADPTPKNDKGLSALDFAMNGPEKNSVELVEEGLRRWLAKRKP